MALLYADENFSRPVVDELRILGHDVMTAQEAGQAGKSIPDSAVLTLAISNQRAVLTFNRRHFRQLHRQTPHHYGIILCTPDEDVVALASRIHQAIVKCPSLENQLLRIVRPAQP